MKKSVLIVDDEEIICESIKDYIEDAEFDIEIHTAFSAAAALEKIQETYISLLVTDLSMPETSGVELIRKIEQLNVSKRPEAIIMMSGLIKKNSEFSTELNIAQLGKPFSAEDMISLIEKIMENSEKEFSIDSEILGDFVEEVKLVTERLHAISKEFENNLENNDLLIEFGNTIFGLAGTASMLELHEIGEYFKAMTKLCKTTTEKNIKKLRAKTRNQIYDCLAIIDLLIESIHDDYALSQIARKLQIALPIVERLIIQINKSV